MQKIAALRNQADIVQQENHVEIALEIVFRAARMWSGEAGDKIFWFENCTNNPPIVMGNVERLSTECTGEVTCDSFLELSAFFLVRV